MTYLMQILIKWFWTKNRPLASNNITKKQAVIIFCMLSVLCFLCALFLHIKSIMIAILSFIMIVCYPLFKRFFIAPQIFLGVTFNMAVFIAFFSAGSGFCYDLIPWFCHAMFFTIFYDVIYAFSDVKCDMKINNHSLSVIVYPVYKNFLFLGSDYYLFIAHACFKNNIFEIFDDFSNDTFYMADK